MTASILEIVVRLASHPAAVRLAVAVLSIATAVVYPLGPVGGGGGV